MSAAQKQAHHVLNLYGMACIINLVGIQKVMLILLQRIWLLSMFTAPGGVPAPATCIQHLRSMICRQFLRHGCQEMDLESVCFGADGADTLTIWDKGGFRSRKWSSWSTEAKLVGSLPAIRTVIRPVGYLYYFRLVQISWDSIHTLIEPLANPELWCPIFLEQAVHQVVLQLSGFRAACEGGHLLSVGGKRLAPAQLGVRSSTTGLTS